jgi:hypothetical protein
LKYTEENAIGAKTGDVNWKNFYINRGREKMIFEKCVCFDADNMPNSARYYTEDKLKCSDDVRFIKKNNLTKKILMWVAISNRGMPIPYFRP